MGRRETAIEPNGRPAQRFAEELRELRRAAGSPSYRVMATRAHYAATTLSVAASGQRLPSLPVVLAYVEACGGDREEWRARWEAAAAHDGARPAPVRWRPSRDLVGAAVVAVVALVAVVLAGTVGGSTRSTLTRSPSASTQSPSAALPVNATVGADCPAHIGTVRVYTVSGPWSVGTRGGWKGDGCAGEFYFESDPDATNRAEWSVPMPAVPLDCYISIFVPDSPHAAGHADYEVRQWVHGSAEVLDRRDVDQAAHHGDWVGTGPYRITADSIVLQMRASGRSPDEVTAGVIHVYCGRPGEV